MLRAIGADHVIDYARGLLAERRKIRCDFRHGLQNAFFQLQNALSEDGCYLMANPGPRRMLRALWVSWTNRKKVIFEFAGESVEDLDHRTGDRRQHAV